MEAGISAKMRTEHLTNINLDRYRYTNVFGCVYGIVNFTLTTNIHRISNSDLLEMSKCLVPTRTESV